MSPTPPNAERSAKLFSCSIGQAKRLMANNAEGMRIMAMKARRTGKPVNGYTAEELETSARDYLEASK